MHRQLIINYLKLMRLAWRQPLLLLILPPILLVAVNKYVDLGSYPTGLNLLGLIIKIIIGGVIVSSLGCVVNDFFDKNIDGDVERTKERPLVKEVTENIYEYAKPTKLGIFLLCGTLSSLAFLVALSLGAAALITSCFALILIMVYPLTKRFFLFPQLFLGATYNFGILIIAAALTQGINIETLIFYFAFIMWTFAYDTVYTAQDRKDDIRLNVYSTVLTLGEERWPKFVKTLYNITFTTFILLGALIKAGPFYFCGCIIAFAWTRYKYSKIDTNNNIDLLKFFNWNYVPMLLILMGVIIDIVRRETGIF